MLMFMLMVLKAAPFNNSIDDWMAFICNFGLTLIMLLGFVLKLDSDNAAHAAQAGEEYVSYFPQQQMGDVLLGICVVVIGVIGGNILRFMIQQEMRSRQRKKPAPAAAKKQRRLAGGQTAVLASTKVAPAGPPPSSQPGVGRGVGPSSDVHERARVWS